MLATQTYRYFRGDGAPFLVHHHSNSPSHSPLSNNARRATDGFDAGTVRSLALAPPSQSPEQRRGRSPQFWCSDASLSTAAAGTVRLHASSHARGLKLYKVALDRPAQS